MKKTKKSKVKCKHRPYVYRIDGIGEHFKCVHCGVVMIKGFVEGIKLSAKQINKSWSDSEETWAKKNDYFPCERFIK